MRRICSFCLAILMIAGLCPVLTPPASAANPQPDEFRALWVSTVINLDYPSAQGLSADTLKREADAILNNAEALGFTAVILQVRPTGDALYQSKLFPWSVYVSGKQGVAPDGGFDPLAYFVEGAHKRGLELHAWLNPFRVARNSADIAALDAKNPAKLNPSWVVSHTDGAMYYNPGVPEVRKLVVDGVREIVENYDVDGIHYDDYFYPGKTFDDTAAFTAHGGKLSLEDWRRDNINKLIQETQEAVHQANADCRFGVSPQAIWAHKSSSPYGSDTDARGNQTFYNQFADTRKWVLSGWVDYIAPQIYWEIGHERSDYQTVLAWWCGLVRNTTVDLYVGHSTYQLNGYNKAAAWQGTDEIVRQIDMARSFPEYKGSIHFRYAFIAKDAAIAAAVKTLHEDTALSVVSTISTTMPAPAGGKLVIGRPSKDTTVSFQNFYIVGASDPKVPLYVNGAEIQNRTSLGYFAYYTPLKNGKNTFTFTQGSQNVTRVITVGGGNSSSTPPSMERAEILAGSAFPELYDEIRTPGETVTLKCTAPIGATVTVRVGGKTFAMTPARSTKPDGGLYSTTFSASYTLPGLTVAGRVVNYGTPVYTMTYEGQSDTRRATASLLSAGDGAPLYAEVVSESAFTYTAASTSGGPSGELCKGQMDYVKAQQGGTWVLLGSGLWVLRSDVRLLSDTKELETVIKGVTYAKGAAEDILSIQTATPTATTAVWNGETLTFTVYNASRAPVASLPSGALMKQATAIYRNGTAVYTLTPADPAQLHGYYVTLSPSGIELHLRRKPQAAGGQTPLQGIHIAVDAGHGGTDGGAPGPLGYDYSEKFINLYASLKLAEALRSLGAQVTLTRSTDTSLELKNRLDASRSARPDLFLSLHCNSMEYDVNSDTIRGVSVFYRELGSAAFAQSLYDHLWQSLGVGKKGCHKSNLYVCRGFWAPSVIVEMGFINNPDDYQWLTSNDRQNELISAMAEGIVRYFN